VFRSHRYLQELQKLHGRVLFVNADWADGWWGLLMELSNGDMWLPEMPEVFSTPRHGRRSYKLQESIRCCL